MSDPLADIAIKGKPWIVFFHGGAFKYFSGISGNYYAPSVCPYSTCRCLWFIGLSLTDCL